jgi:hypothetical protein
LTEAACILSLSCCILDNLYIHKLGVQRYGMAYAMAYAPKPLDASRFQNSTATHGFSVRAARGSSFRKVVAWV